MENNSLDWPCKPSSATTSSEISTLQQLSQCQKKPTPGIAKKRNMQQIDTWEHRSYDWLQTPPSDVMSSEMVIGPLGLPIRYIQHQRLSDLYWQFLAEWEVHVERNPSEGTCPCFNTFSKRYLSHWKHVLVMRKVSQHGQCKLCFDLHQILQIYQSTNCLWKASASMHSFLPPTAESTTEVREARKLREHQRQQYQDRSLLGLAIFQYS